MKPAGFTSVMASRIESADSLDLFCTPPWAARAGGELIRRIDPLAKTCWEPACGLGHMAWGLLDYFEEVLATDVFDYGFGGVLDFLGEEASDPKYRRYDFIVSNPPFRLAEDFVRAALPRARRGAAMLLRSVFLEGAGRNPIFTDPAMGFACHAQFAERVPMVKGRWDPAASTATAYSWFVWVKPDVDDLDPVIGDSISNNRRNAALGDPWFHLGCIIPPGTKARLSKPADLVRFADHSPIEGGLLP